jgi:hypothetical protein
VDREVLAAARRRLGLAGVVARVAIDAARALRWLSDHFGGGGGGLGWRGVEVCVGVSAGGLALFADG